MFGNRRNFFFLVEPVVVVSVVFFKGFYFDFGELFGLFSVFENRKMFRRIPIIFYVFHPMSARKINRLVIISDIRRVRREKVRYIDITQLQEAKT